MSVVRFTLDTIDTVLYSYGWTPFGCYMFNGGHWSAKTLENGVLGSCDSNGNYTGFTGTATAGGVTIACTGSVLSISNEASPSPSTMTIEPNSCYVLGVAPGDGADSYSLLIGRVRYGGGIVTPGIGPKQIYCTTDDADLYGQYTLELDGGGPGADLQGTAAYVNGTTVVLTASNYPNDGFDYNPRLSSSGTGSLNQGSGVYVTDDFMRSHSHDEPEDDTDPYAEGGNSDSGGGTGNFDNSSDTIPVPSLPSISGLNTGFFTAFVASAAQMRQVADYLWTTLLPDISQGGVVEQAINSLKKIVSNPYDAIMGCSIIPVTPATGGSKSLKMYGVIDTNISIPYASSRWVSVDCGTLNINEYWGGYLDYSPYTKTTSLYLPYIGTVSIDIDLIMAKALQVIYHVDILSGICIAYILVNGSVEFSYQGHCATTIPITSADFTSSVQSGLGLIGNVANIVGGAAAGSTAGLGGALLGAAGSAISQSPAIASNVMNMKPDIKSGGGIGGAGGILGVQKPYLIVERARQSLPVRQNAYTGYPCNISLSINDCSGYTEYETINLDGVLLTSEEKDELQKLLQSGVYL